MTQVSFSQESVSLSDQLLFFGDEDITYGRQKGRFYTLPQLVDAIIKEEIDAHPIAKKAEAGKGKKKQKVQYTYSAPSASLSNTTSLEFRINSNVVSEEEILYGGLVVAHMPASMIKRFNEEIQKNGLYEMSKKYNTGDLLALLYSPAQTTVNISEIKKFMGIGIPVYGFEEFNMMEKDTLPEYYAVVFDRKDANNNEKVKIARFGGTERYFTYKQLLKEALEDETIKEDKLDAQNFPAERQLYLYNLKFHQYAWPPSNSKKALPSVLEILLQNICLHTAGRKMKFSLLELFSPPSARGLEYYLKHIRLPAESFEGKTILNLGAGGTDLEKELALSGVNSTVYNLDFKYPRFGKPELTPGWPEKSIKADMADLDRYFPEDSLDYVISSEGLCRWLPYKKQIVTINKAINALKSHGEIYVFNYQRPFIPVYSPKKIISELERMHGDAISISYSEKTLKIIKK